MEQNTKDIYMEACEKIAEEFSPLGFKYLKSKPSLKKTKGDLTFEITFGSSRFNSKDRKIAINLHAWVFSKKIKAWRSEQKQCAKPSNQVAHSDIRYLSEPWIKDRWNLADSNKRNECITDITNSIKKNVIPFFEKFESVDDMEAALQKNEAKGFSNGPDSFIEYALCFFTPEIARQATISYLEKVKKTKRSYEGLEDFSEAYNNFHKYGIDNIEKLNGHAEIVGYYSVKY